MRDVTIRVRDDGIVELAPKIAPLEPGDRLMVIVTVLLVTGGLFLCGAIPAAVAGVVAASCVAGDLVLLVKSLALAALRPVAQVREVPRFRGRRAR